MKKLSLKFLIALSMFSFAFAGSVLAADTTPTPMESAKCDDFAAGKKSHQRQQLDCGHR